MGHRPTARPREANSASLHNWPLAATPPLAPMVRYLPLFAASHLPMSVLCMQLRVQLSRYPAAHPVRIPALQCSSAGLAAVPQRQLSCSSLCMTTMPPQPSQPPWVDYVNRALETSATTTLLAFVLIDFVSALAILGALVALQVPVGADFALALALSKALKGPRLALDTSFAALLGRCFPSLKAVRLALLAGEVSEAFAGVRRAFDEGRAEAAGNSPPVGGFPPGFSPRPKKRASASASAAKMLTEYGLAYMAAKSIIGPACTLLVLAALRSGGRAQAVTAWLMRTFRVTSGPVGALAGQMALAVTLSSVLFPLVVVAAAALGPMMAASRDDRTAPANG